MVSVNHSRCVSLTSVQNLLVELATVTVWICYNTHLGHELWWASKKVPSCSSTSSFTSWKYIANSQMQSLLSFLTDPVTQLRRKMNLIHEEIKQNKQEDSGEIFWKISCNTICSIYDYVLAKLYKFMYWGSEAILYLPRSLYSLGIRLHNKSERLFHLECAGCSLAPYVNVLPPLPAFSEVACLQRIPSLR